MGVALGVFGPPAAGEQLKFPPVGQGHGAAPLPVDLQPCAQTLVKFHAGVHVRHGERHMHEMLDVFVVPHRLAKAAVRPHDRPEFDLLAAGRAHKSHAQVLVGIGLRVAPAGGHGAVLQRAGKGFVHIPGVVANMGDAARVALVASLRRKLQDHPVRRHGNAVVIVPALQRKAQALAVKAHGRVHVRHPQVHMVDPIDISHKSLLCLSPSRRRSCCSHTLSGNTGTE